MSSLHSENPARGIELTQTFYVRLCVRNKRMEQLQELSVLDGFSVHPAKFMIMLLSISCPHDFQKRYLCLVCAAQPLRNLYNMAKQCNFLELPRIGKSSRKYNDLVAIGTHRKMMKMNE